MKGVKLDSEQNSGRMSPTGRQLRPLRKSERNFLADQAADAKTAMTGTLHDMEDTLFRVANERSCAKQHPWLVVGSAVVAGFVTGAVLTAAPRKSTATSGSSTETVSQPSPHRQETKRTKKSFLLSAIAAVLVGIVQNAGKSLIAAAVAHDPVTQDLRKGGTPSPQDSTEEVEFDD
jgi:hypothetical protein